MIERVRKVGDCWCADVGNIPEVFEYQTVNEGRC